MPRSQVSAGSRRAPGALTGCPPLRASPSPHTLLGLPVTWGLLLKLLRCGPALSMFQAGPSHCWPCIST